MIVRKYCEGKQPVRPACSGEEPGPTKRPKAKKWHSEEPKRLRTHASVLLKNGRAVKLELRLVLNRAGPRLCSVQSPGPLGFLQVLHLKDLAFV